MNLILRLIYISMEYLFENYGLNISLMCMDAYYTNFIYFRNEYAASVVCYFGNHVLKAGLIHGSTLRVLLYSEIFYRAITFIYVYNIVNILNRRGVKYSRVHYLNLIKKD